MRRMGVVSRPSWIVGPGRSLELAPRTNKGFSKAKEHSHFNPDSKSRRIHQDWPRH